MKENCCKCFIPCKDLVWMWHMVKWGCGSVWIINFCLLCCVLYKKVSVPPCPIVSFGRPTAQQPCLPDVPHHPPHAFHAAGRNVLTWRSAGKTSEWGTLCSCSAMRLSQQTSCCSTPLTRTGSATWKPPTWTGRPTWSSAARWWASAARSVWAGQPQPGLCPPKGHTWLQALLRGVWCCMAAGGQPVVPAKAPIAFLRDSVSLSWHATLPAEAGGGVRAQLGAALRHSGLAVQ